MVAKQTVGLVTYVGFDPANNGKRWIEERGNYTYVKKQNNEFSIEHVSIIAYDKKYLEEAKKHRYTTPPRYLEREIDEGKIIYYFWFGKDHWMSSKEEAINYIHIVWDAE